MKLKLKQNKRYNTNSVGGDNNSINNIGINNNRCNNR